MNDLVAALTLIGVFLAAVLMLRLAQQREKR